MLTTNFKSIAVALRYRKLEVPAPQLIAEWMGELAAQLRRPCPWESRCDGRDSLHPRAGSYAEVDSIRLSLDCSTQEWRTLVWAYTLHHDCRPIDTVHKPFGDESDPVLLLLMVGILVVLLAPIAPPLPDLPLITNWSFGPLILLACAHDPAAFPRVRSAKDKP